MAFIFLASANNKNMLDYRSKTILVFLVKECAEGSYRVFEIKDIIACLPSKIKPDESTVKLCLEYLEKGEYISIKYKDENVCCLTPLPFARQILEAESSQRAKDKKLIKMGSFLYFLVFIFAFFGSFLAIIVYGLIF